MPEVTFDPPEHWRRVLEQVVARLNIGDDGSTSLWNVLTALRGPDVQDSIYPLKSSTTAVIRKHIGLVRTIGIPVAIKDDSDTAVQTRISLLAGPNRLRPAHFYSHVVMAFRALGLQWCDLNPTKESEEKTTTKS